MKKRLLTSAKNWVEHNGFQDISSLLTLAQKLEPIFTESGFRENGPIRSILVIREDNIGDFIVTSGMLRELRRNYPTAFITLICSPSAYGLAALCPYVNEVISFRGARSLQMPDFSAWFLSYLNLCYERLWPHHYDMCLLPMWGGDMSPNILQAYLSGSHYRYGYSNDVARVYFPDRPHRIDLRLEEQLLTKALFSPPEIVNEAARCFYLLQAVGMNVSDNHLEIWNSGEDDFWASSQVKNVPRTTQHVVALGIGASDENRKYPIPLLTDVIKELLSKESIHFFVIGGKDEETDGRTLASISPEHITNFAGKVSLTKSIALLSHCTLYLGNDTGMMHAAAAAGVPIIVIAREAADRINVIPGLFGELARFAPWKVPYIVIRPQHQLGECQKHIVYGGCMSPHAHCIAQIPPKAVVQAYRTMLEHLHQTSVI